MDKICDLSLKENHKKLLYKLDREPMSIAQCAAELSHSYQYTAQTLMVWEAKGWIKKMTTLSGKILHKLNPDVLDTSVSFKK